MSIKSFIYFYGRILSECEDNKWHSGTGETFDCGKLLNKFNEYASAKHFEFVILVGKNGNAAHYLSISL